MAREEYVIDCGADAKPMSAHGGGQFHAYVPWRHDRGDRIVWRPERAALYHANDARRDRGDEGEFLEVRKFYDHTRSTKRVMNANVLDALLMRPDLIPEAWKKPHGAERGPHVILFLGTLYRAEDERHPTELTAWKCDVRGLFWNEKTGRWGETSWYLDRDKNFHQSAAVFID